MRSPSGRVAGAVPIVDDLADPDAAPIVDVDIRRAGNHRLGSKQRRLQPGSHVQSGHSLRRRMLIVGSEHRIAGEGEPSAQE